jgi:hypothetical protein
MNSFVGKITDQPEGRVLHSGNLIKLQFSKNDDRAELSGTPDEFEALTLKLLALVTAAISQRHTTNSPHAILAVPAEVQAVKAAPRQKGQIFLSLKSDKGLVYAFSISTQDVPALIQGLTAAEKKTK